MKSVSIKKLLCNGWVFLKRNKVSCFLWAAIGAIAVNRRAGAQVKVVLCWLKRYGVDCLFWGIFAAFSGAFVLVAWEFDDGYIQNLLGAMNKHETLKFIGFGIGGVLAAIGAIAFNRRAGAQVRNNELIEKGHAQDRFKTATEHLGSEKAGVNIAAYYEFYQLAKDNEGLRQDIFELLCAHLRQITIASDYEGKETPTEGVQTLIDLLFKSEDEYIFQGLKADLRRTYLVCANFYKANLQNANLDSAQLRGANFTEANLQGAQFDNVDIRDNDFEEAELNMENPYEDMKKYSVIFNRAKLHGAKFNDAILPYAHFYNAELQRTAESRRTLFYQSDFRYAQFMNADLRNAFIVEVKFLGVSLDGAKLQGADFVIVSASYEMENKLTNVEVDENTKLPPNTCVSAADGNIYKADKDGKLNKQNK